MHDLKNLVEELGIASKVEMPGSVVDVDTYLLHSSIFAFTSISEGYPNALSEALTAGLACVSSDCPSGPKDLIEDGKNGILVKMGDVEALTEKLMLLATNDSERERLGRSARISAQGRMVKIVAQKFLKYCLSQKSQE
jgi:GalNAc-alpha-(1->4)-GalNAc-alpha-(1->3)-diNAcBac-PP-undecaprenol alpha-1,4-N-acetyl-D-galactosaminyltransferase